MTSAKNIPAKQLGFIPSAAIFTRIANGASGVIVPAPPAGFMNLATFVGHNADVANTLVIRCHDADGDFVGSAAVAALGDSFLIGNSFPVLATTDITAVISAGTGGTPCEFRGVYNQVPIPVGMQRAVLVMTNAYQSLAAVVPASGVNVGYSLMPILVSTLQGIAVYNGDTAACTVNFRLTRGSTAFLWNNTVSAPPSRAAFFPVEPLLPGDVFEAKLAAPPNVAGSIILRANFVPSP